ncbi:MAG: putative metal-binding motif-containing protein [Sandaracinaceae bacterium]
MKRLAPALASLGAVFLVSCSLIFSGDDLRGDAEDAGPADAGPVDADPADTGPGEADSGPCVIADCVEDGGVDLDCDGFCADEDCDDTRNRIYPGAPRICGDNFINDCNEWGELPPEPGDARRLRALTGEVVMGVDQDDIPFPDVGSKGAFEAAMSPSDDTSPNLLTVLRSDPDGIGFELLMGPATIGATLLRDRLETTGCFANGVARVQSAAVSANEPGFARIALGRTVSGVGGAEAWRQGGTATYDPDAPSVTMAYGRCRETSTLLDLHAVGALTSAAGDALSGSYATRLGTSGGPEACLSVGDQGCQMGIATGTPTDFGVGLGGLMLGSVRRSSNAVIVARNATGEPEDFAEFGAVQLSGRIDAAHEGTAAVVVGQVDQDLLVVESQCADEACLGIVPTAPAGTVRGDGRLASNEARVSVTPLGSGRFIIAYRSRASRIGLSLYDSVEDTLSEQVELDGLAFMGTTLFNLHVVSAQNQVRQIVMVLAVTGETSSAADTLHRFRFSACRRP